MTKWGISCDMSEPVRGIGLRGEDHQERVHVDNIKL